MQDLQQKIQQHFEQQEVKEKFDKIVNLMFKDAKKREEFLRIFELIKKGEFDILDLDRYMVEEMDLDKDKVFNFNDELFHETYIDVYFEMQDLYNEKHNLAKPEERMSEQSTDKSQMSTDNTDNKEDEVEDLIEKYNSFIHASLFENILAKQEQLKQNYFKDNQLNLEDLKNEFYEAINSGEKIRLGACLRLLAETGNLRKAFSKDQRYIDFWSGYLNRHGRDKDKEEFLKDPAKEKFLVQFFRFILEKRVSFNQQESAMIGVNLSSLAAENEDEYKDMAFGDEATNSFKWQL